MGYIALQTGLRQVLNPPISSSIILFCPFPHYSSYKTVNRLQNKIMKNNRKNSSKSDPQTLERKEQIERKGEKTITSSTKQEMIKTREGWLV